MKKILITIIFSSFACWTYAEEPSKESDSSVFDIAGDARVKQFIINQEPDQIKVDYRGNNDHADEELGLNARGRICRYLYIDIDPYFWRSNENKISRIGLKAEAKVSICNLDKGSDWLRIGYGHHSWHNVDVGFKGAGGRSQDWLFAEIDFFKYQDRENGKDLFSANFQIKPKIYLNNRDPSAIKEVYGKHEAKAIAALELPMDFVYKDGAEIHLKPSWMFSRDMDRYGVWAELDVKIWKGIWVFVDGTYYRAGPNDRAQLGVGLDLRFK